MTAVILAGGDGLRLRPLTCTMPKAMLSVANVPLIDYTLDILEQSKFTDCIIAADRISGRLTEYLDDGCAVDFSISENPMGTSHALSEAAKKTNGFIYCQAFPREGQVMRPNCDTCPKEPASAVEILNQNIDAEVEF